MSPKGHPGPTGARSVGVSPQLTLSCQVRRGRGESLARAQSQSDASDQAAQALLCSGGPTARCSKRPDPYPDLGRQAVREGLGIVLYVRTAFGPRLEGSVLVPVEPVVTLPFSLVWREDARSAALDVVLAAP